MPLLYTIVSSHSAEKLEEQVQELLDSGWTLRGELVHAMCHDGDGDYTSSFAQALTIEDEEK